MQKNEGPSTISHRRIAVALLLLSGTAAYSEQPPAFSAAGPDSDAYGAAEHFPTGSPTNFFEKKYMVGSFSHFDLLFPARSVPPAATVWKFQRPVNPSQITYVQAGNRCSVQDYLSHLPVTGLLIAKDDQILFEGYQYGRTDRDRLTSQSMAKTIVGMLTGVALSEQALASVKDAAQKYVPELKDAPYGKVTIQNLLHMSSGMSCENSESTMETVGLQTLIHDCKQAAPEGKRFSVLRRGLGVTGADSHTLRTHAFDLLSRSKNLEKHRHGSQRHLDNRPFRS